MLLFLAQLADIKKLLTHSIIGLCHSWRLNFYRRCLCRIQWRIQRGAYQLRPPPLGDGLTPSLTTPSLKSAPNLVFGRGSVPDPDVGAYSAPIIIGPLADLRGFTSKGEIEGRERGKIAEGDR